MASKNSEQPDDGKDLKIDKWDGAAIKNSLDDAAKRVFMEDYGYVESHSLMDGRLAICTVAVAFAMFALVWDFLHPFPESRPLLIVCVLSYFAMMGVLTLYTSVKERGCFVIALDKDKAGIDPPHVWRLSSQLKRYDDQYTLNATFTDGTTSNTRSVNFTKSVASFFDEDGYLLSELFDPEIQKIHASLTSEKKSK